MSHGTYIRPIFVFFALLVALIMPSETNARELSPAGEWRVFENAEACWTTTHIKGTNYGRTGGKVYVSARLARDGREPEISLTIARAFPKGLGIGLVADGKSIPLVIVPPQTAFPEDNRFALKELKAASTAVYISGGKGYEVDLDDFQKALKMIAAACS